MIYEKANAEIIVFNHTHFMTQSAGGHPSTAAEAQQMALKEPEVVAYLAEVSSQWYAEANAYQGPDGYWYVEVNVKNHGGHTQKTFGPYVY